MLIATHSIAGGIAGEYIGNPFLAFLAGIVIHFLLDTIPHYDTTDDGKFTFRQLAFVGADCVAGLIILIFIMRADLSIKSPFLWGAIGGILPDIFDCLPGIQDYFRKTSFGKKIHEFHDAIQIKSKGIKPWLGVLIQYSILALFVILYLAKK
jgi:hypothetical protein